jgi:gamma-glutamylcyclotransferase (GGCT)/AIG2-like uncharacterized protein YtfP
LIHYFAFGSNLSSARLRARAPSALAVGAATLADHRLVLDRRASDGSGKVNLVREPGARVWGVVFTLSPADLSVLDGFEPGYARIEARVEMHGGSALDVHLYVSDERCAEDLRAHAWYKAFVVEGAREHALPDDWIAFLDELPVHAP